MENKTKVKKFYDNEMLKQEVAFCGVLPGDIFGK